MRYKFDDEEYITAEEIMPLIKCKRAKLDNLVRNNKFPKPIKIEVQKFWKKSEIEDYLSKTRGEEV